jgi:diadenosine tetraphosphate (Ap4A) HIT family hydrolase
MAHGRVDEMNGSPVAGKEEGCLFCDGRDKAIWAGAGFYLLLDVAPLIEGHSLLIPDDHYSCAADLPGELLDQLDELSAWFRRVYDDTYRTVTMFEHGRTGHCLRRHSNEQMCNHMHIHLLPMAEDITPQIGLGQRTRWSSWRELAAIAADADGYVLTDTPQSGRYVCPVTRSLVPHYLRSRAAEALGEEDRADWEELLRRGSTDAMVESARLRLAVRTGSPTSGPPRAARVDGPACWRPTGTLPSGT